MTEARTEYSPSIDSATKVLIEDDFDAQRFVEVISEGLFDEWAYSSALRTWYHWEGTHWAAQTSDAGIRGAAGRRIIEARKAAPDDLQKRALSRAAKLISPGGQATLGRLVASSAAFHVEPADFNRKSHLLPCANGTVDLRTGKLAEHDPDDLFNFCVPVEFDAGATSRAWERFLLDIADAEGRESREALELVLWLQRALGYSLTGETSEQCMFVIVGDGANGKSALLSVLWRVLASPPLLRAFDPEILLATDRQAQYGLAHIAGCRMVSGVESTIARRMNEAQVKRLTGSDPVTAAKKYGHEFEFSPIFKLWLATNHRPTIRGRDEGIWRRIRMVPFTASFLGREDRMIVERLATERAPAILAWLVAGAQAWYADGLGDCPVVSEETSAFRADSDAVAEYLEDRIDFLEGHEISKADLRADVTLWAQRTGYGPALIAEVVAELQRLGHDRRNKARRYWGDVRFKTPMGSLIG